jgi:SAM-dependent methyltransferase
MYLLVPGRHHCLTDFQFKYLSRLAANGLEGEPDANGNALTETKRVSAVVWAVTSANHSNTRRNPTPFYLRAMALLDFSQELMVPAYVFGIDDVGKLNSFAEYTLKKIKHESEGLLDLNPTNTIVVCSSPVRHIYAALGFKILPMELKPGTDQELLGPSPWELVERVAKDEGYWRRNREVFDQMHQSSFLVWTTYGIGEKVKRLYSDDMIGSDGDLTESRDYNSYVRQMDDIAELKYKETAAHIQPGRIGDIGCAVGSWILLACKDERLRESDFVGIEIARALYQICLQRKENKEFANPFVFFAQKNAVEGLCFDANSMNTIYTGSLTHEIESYGGRADLLRFIQNRYQELVPGGVWVNRDVVGPTEKEKNVLLWLNENDGEPDANLTVSNGEELKAYLQQRSTLAKFEIFAREFRAEEGDGIQFEWLNVGQERYASMTLADAMEFISKKDYHDNWRSEMHERFCFWNFAEWQNELTKAGFQINSASHAYPNQWLIDHRYKGKVALFTFENGQLQPLSFPETHMLMVATRQS